MSHQARSLLVFAILLALLSGSAPAANAEVVQPCRRGPWAAWQQDPDFVRRCPDTPGWTQGNNDLADQDVTCTTPKGEKAPSLREEGPYYRTTASYPTDPKKKAFRIFIQYKALDAKDRPAPPARPQAPEGCDKKETCEARNEHFGNSGIYIFKGTVKEQHRSGLYEVLIVDPSKFGFDYDESPKGPFATRDKIPHQRSKKTFVSNACRIDKGKPDLKEAVIVTLRTQLLPGGMYKVDPRGPNKPEAPDNDPKFTNWAKPDDWNDLEIDFCPYDDTDSDPAKVKPARVKTMLNGHEVFNGPILGPDGKTPAKGTGNGASADAFAKQGPIYLQSHFGSQVAFRRPSIQDLNNCTAKETFDP